MNIGDVGILAGVGAIGVLGSGLLGQSIAMDETHSNPLPGMGELFGAAIVGTSFFGLTSLMHQSMPHGTKTVGAALGAAAGAALLFKAYDMAHEFTLHSGPKD